MNYRSFVHRGAVWAVAFSTLAAGGCSKDRDASQAATGLTAPDAIPTPVVGAADRSATAGNAAAIDPSRATANPHAMPAAVNPHALPGRAPNPHGGLDPAAAGDSVANPHTGLGQATVEPGTFLRGTLRGDAKTASLIRPGDIIFLTVKPVDPKTGTLGPTVAVDRYDVESLPLSFTLDGSDVMTTAVPFSGDVAILARLDRDGEARTARPGDIEGRVDATIPADDLELVLDTVRD